MEGILGIAGELQAQLELKQRVKGAQFINRLKIAPKKAKKSMDAAFYLLLGSCFEDCFPATSGWCHCGESQVSPAVSPKISLLPVGT